MFSSISRSFIGRQMSMTALIPHTEPLGQVLRGTFHVLKRGNVQKVDPPSKEELIFPRKDLEKEEELLQERELYLMDILGVSVSTREARKQKCFTIMGDQTDIKRTILNDLIQCPFHFKYGNPMFKKNFNLIASPMSSRFEVNDEFDHAVFSVDLSHDITVNHLIGFFEKDDHETVIENNWNELRNNHTKVITFTGLCSPVLDQLYENQTPFSSGNHRIGVGIKHIDSEFINQHDVAEYTEEINSTRKLFNNGVVGLLINKDGGIISIY